MNSNHIPQITIKTYAGGGDFLPITVNLTDAEQTALQRWYGTDVPTKFGVADFSNEVCYLSDITSPVTCRLHARGARLALLAAQSRAEAMVRTFAQ